LCADPDPDPIAQINADPCGSGSETLLRSNQLFRPSNQIVVAIPGIVPTEINRLFRLAFQGPRNGARRLTVVMGKTLKCEKYIFAQGGHANFFANPKILGLIPLAQIYKFLIRLSQIRTF
jgi:hypothetical protein